MLKPVFSFADDLKHEHVSLLDQLGLLEEGIASWPADCHETLLGSLLEVQASLRRHFHFEEQGGYMSQILDDAPHLHHAAQALLAQHARISIDLDSLIAAVAYLSPECPVTLPLRGQLKQWVQLVRDHESRENHLTQKACNEDIGADD
jgi:hypothetical protein